MSNHRTNKRTNRDEARRKLRRILNNAKDIPTVLRRGIHHFGWNTGPSRGDFSRQGKIDLFD